LGRESRLDSMRTSVFRHHWGRHSSSRRVLSSPRAECSRFATGFAAADAAYTLVAKRILLHRHPRVSHSIHVEGVGNLSHARDSHLAEERNRQGVQGHLEITTIPRLVEPGADWRSTR